MIDLHAHLLPGLDDGPSTVRDALEMARVAVAGGITTVVCTPHVIAKYPNRAEGIRAAADAFQAELDAAGIALRVVPGAEISLTVLGGLDDDELRGLSLGGSGWLLLELPFHGWPLRLPQLIGELEIRGFRVVLAHPERSESVQLHPGRVQELVGRGALLQITAGSLTGDHGPRARQAARRLLRNHTVHLLASDAHSATWRPPALAEGLSGAARVLRLDADELRWMVEDGPAEILAGGPVRPPRIGVPRPVTRTAPGADGPPRGARPERRHRGGPPQARPPRAGGRPRGR
jgi:protein-tyrosine phosphatase